MIQPDQSDTAAHVTNADCLTAAVSSQRALILTHPYCRPHTHSCICSSLSKHRVTKPLCLFTWDFTLIIELKYSDHWMFSLRLIYFRASLFSVTCWLRPLLTLSRCADSAVRNEERMTGNTVVVDILQHKHRLWLTQGQKKKKILTNKAHTKLASMILLDPSTQSD